MGAGGEPGELSLERRVDAAHGTYILALVASEQAAHELKCPLCGPMSGSRDERFLRSLKAKADREACRIVLRDLLDALGYVPKTFTTTVPASEDGCCGAAMSAAAH